MGYQVLARAVNTLATNPETADVTIGTILSFALNDFAMVPVFISTRQATQETRDATLTTYFKRMGNIVRPEALKIIWDLLSSTSDHVLRYAILKTFEHLSQSSHRNHIVLGTLDLSAFELFRTSTNTDERHVTQKLLRKLMDAGPATKEARYIFQKALNPDDTINLEVLELIRVGMKARWPTHFSLEEKAYISVREPPARGLPSTGFTVMVRSECI